MANQLSPPPVRTPFAGKDPSGSGVSWPWLKWFQDIFTQIGTVLVVSVFGRTGAVTPQAGDYPPNLGGTGQTAWNKGNLLVGTGPNSTDLKPIGAAGSVLTADPTKADGVDWKNPAVSSATNLTMPLEFTVTGSGPGTIAVTKAAEIANSVWSGPASGGAAPPTFRPITALVGSYLNFADSETPAGTVDGVNKTFTLAHAPNPPLSLLLFENIGGAGNYVLQVPAAYTLTGNSIVYAVAPTVGTLHKAWYRYSV
jgi:hypothetical protein